MHYTGVVNRIVHLLESSGASNDFIGFMRLGIGLDQKDISSDMSLSRWADLPGLCCQAAGGDPEWADDLAAAWLLYYSAAHLMDKVQDQDEPDPWWKELGSSIALSTATGLYFIASRALDRLAQTPPTKTFANEIREDFHRKLLLMADGQYQELTGPPQTLDQYWKRSEAKSGIFFSIACKNGARLATSDFDLISGYEQLGRIIGLLIQITDDLDDILPSTGAAVPGQKKELLFSLPVVYTLSVIPAKQQLYLKSLLDTAKANAEAATQAIQIINEAGATTYIIFEISRLSHQAHQIIQGISMPGAAQNKLNRLVEHLANPQN